MKTYETFSFTRTSFFFFSKYVFVSLKTRLSNTEGEISHLLGHSSNNCTIPGWARWMLGVWISIWIFWHFLRHIGGKLDWKRSSWDLISQSYGVVSITEATLNYNANLHLNFWLTLKYSQYRIIIIYRRETFLSLTLMNS